MQFRELAVLASVPGVIDVREVDGCELVQLVAVRQLGISASCNGLGGTFSFASWYPDPQRVLKLLAETIEAGGGVIEYRSGGIVVSGNGDEVGASGATVDRNDVDDDEVFLDGLGAVAPGDPDAFRSVARTGVGGSLDETVVLPVDVDTAQGLVELGKLDVQVAAVGERTALRGSQADLDLVRQLLAGADEVLHSVGDLFAVEDVRDLLGGSFAVDVREIGGRVVLRGAAVDVASAVAAVHSLGLVRQSRAVDVAFVLASRDAISSLGVDFSSSLGGGDVVASVGPLASPGIRAVVDHLSSAGGLDVEERPSLTVRDGKPSQVVVGRDVPVIVTGGTDDEGPQFEYRSTGTILTVSTEPALGGMVAVELDLEVSSVDGEGVGGNPVVATRSYKSSLVLDRGQTAVIATLSSKDASAQNRRSNIVGFGRSRQERTSQLTVLVEIR